MANSIIRQEINILDSVLSAAGGASATSNEIVELDATAFNSPTYYFEVIADSSVSISFTVTLNGATDGTLATCTIPLLTTAYTRIRSASFTPTTGIQNCTAVISNTAGATKNVRSAKIIVIQSAASLLTTQTQVEIGDNFLAQTNTAAGPLTNAKYWLYTAGNWSSTKAFYADVTWKTSAANTTTITLQEDDGAFASWADKVTIVNAGTGGITRTRSAIFTPTDGRHYRIAAKSSTTKSNYSIYNAKLVIYQINNPLQDDFNDNKIGVAWNLQGPSPTTYLKEQNQRIEIATSGVSGEYRNLVSNANYDITGTGFTSRIITVGSNLANVNGVPLILDPDPSLGNTSKLFFSLDGSGGVMTLQGYKVVATVQTNVFIINYDSALHKYVRIRESGGTTFWDTSADGSSWTNQWSEANPIAVTALYVGMQAGQYGAQASTTTYIFDSFNCINDVITSAITNTEPQYLLLNTADGGTGLQTFKTLWDSTEWNDTQGGLPAFKYSHDATNAADSSKLNDITTTVDVTGAVVTGANQQISSAFTMPATGDQLDTNVTNSTGVVGAVRILVIYVVVGPAAVGGATAFMTTNTMFWGV